MGLLHGLFRWLDGRVVSGYHVRYNNRKSSAKHLLASLIIDLEKPWHCVNLSI